MKKPKPFRQEIKTGVSTIFVKEGLCGLIVITQKFRGSEIELIVEVDFAKELSNAIYDASEAIYRNGARM